MLRGLLDALHPWPLEEAVLRPLVSLLLAFLVPIASARVLAALLLPARLEGEGHARAVLVAPFRSAAFVVGLVQLQLAWVLGVTALGPAWVRDPNGVWSELFGALTVVAAFVGGGVGRMVESERLGEGARPTTRDVVVLRLRLSAYLLGPLAVVHVASLLPFVDELGAVQWIVLAAAWALVVAGVAYGGLVALVATGALRRPSEHVASMARRAAQREGVLLASVWRLPTGTVRFANAAAIPWARTMVVTDRIVEILDDDELDAVLAHEAGHLSEAPWVALARVGTAATLVACLSLGPTLLWALGVPAEAQLAALALLALTGLLALLAVSRLARRMEVRADARAREHVGAEPLARALEKLHADALAPMVTGRKRVHPDLYDRLAACGRALPERPSPARVRGALLVGLGVAASLGVAGWLADDLTRLPAAEAELADEAQTWRRLRVDPWDASGALALAWQARRREDLERAEAYATEAARLGVPDPQRLELEAELHAARGDCERARETFDRALAARVVDPLESSLELGGYRIPPSLLTECGMGDPRQRWE